MTCMAASVEIGIRQERQEARALHRVGELTLKVRARAGDARRDDLAVLADEVLQQIDVLVVDPLHLLRGEATELAPLEQRLGAFRVPFSVAALAFAAAFASGWGHFYSPSENSIWVACSTGCRLVRLLAARKPVTVTALPSLAAASSFASRSNATAEISQSTLRSLPASASDDSWLSRNLSTGTPAGVWRKASSSTILPPRMTRFACGKAF